MITLFSFFLIPGEFGSGVAAVFRFTRWAVLLNMFLSLLWIGFLVVPAAISFDYQSLDQYTFSPENVFDGKVCGAYQSYICIIDSNPIGLPVEYKCFCIIFSKARRQD